MAKTPTSQCSGPGVRHMVRTMPLIKMLCATSVTGCSQINKQIFKQSALGDVSISQFLLLLGIEHQLPARTGVSTSHTLPLICAPPGWARGLSPFLTDAEIETSSD